MAGTFGSFFSSTQEKHERTRHRSLFAWRGHHSRRRVALTGTVLAVPFALALAMLPLTASPASAAGAWTATITGTSGATTTSTVTPDGDAGFAYIVYEPTNTPFTASSPTAGCVNGADGWVCEGDLIFTTGLTTPQNVSITIDQLTPNTAYHYELQAEDDNGSTYDSSPGTFSTTPAPTGPGTPINPPSNPSSNGIFGQCSGDAVCVNDMNGVRANQEQLAALSLPSNWSSLSGPEQMFVWTNLERTSRGEAAIPNLVNTYDGAVQTGLTNDDDPSLSDLPGHSGSIWAGAYATVLGAIYGWMYDDGFGGGNEDCTSATAPGCWGHRDNILADPATFGSSPTEMDAGVGTDSSNNADYDAIFVANPNPSAPGNIVFTWAEEQALVGASPPSISGVTLTGTPASPTITVTGSNFGASAPADSPETCQNGDTGDIFSASGLVFQDLSEGWGAGEAGDCIGLLLTSWSSTKVVFTLGSQYANFGPIKTGDQVEATILGAPHTVTASFTAAAVPTIISSTPATGPTTGGTTVTITGTNFTGATAVTFGAAGAAKSFTVVSPTQITAVTAAASAGEHYVTVTTPGGTSADKANVVFTYVGAPTITTSTPASVPTTGGTTVTITGTNFTGATAVTFGAAGAAKSFTVVSSTKITAVTAAASAGEHYVTVTTPSGTSADKASVVFTYN
jgi:hypothetical protein